MEPTPQDVTEAREALAGLDDKRAVQVYRWLFGRRGERPQIEGQLAIQPPRPEVCPSCQELVCDADCALAAKMGWPTEAEAART